MAISRNQALDFLSSDDLIGLGMEADSVRRRLHPERVVTYSLDRSILARGIGPHSLHNEIAEALAMGCTAVRLGSLTPAHTLESAVALLEEIKQRYPQLRVQAFAAPEILTLASRADLSLRETLIRLRDAGLDAISGTGAEIFAGRPGASCTAEDWLAVHRNAHQHGMRTAAVMLFGAGESVEERVNFLDQVRTLQEQTGGFTAFIPRNAQATTAAGRMEEATAVEYLKVLAVSRLYLDNIPNIQSSWAAQGLKVLQMGLRFGGNDAGSVAPEETSARAATEEELRQIIRDAGFKPVQRDTLYRAMFLN